MTPALPIRRCSGNSDRAGPAGAIATKWAIRGSERPVALDRHAATGSDVGVIVPQCHVLNAAIVPKCDRVGSPAEPHLELRPGRVLEEIIQDGTALLFGKPVDMGRKSLIDEQRLALGHGMSAYDRMRRLRKDLATVVARTL